MLMMMSLIYPASEEHWEHSQSRGNGADQLPCIDSDFFSVSDAADIIMLPLLLLLMEEEYFHDHEVNYDERASNIVDLGLTNHTTIN